MSEYKCNLERLLIKAGFRLIHDGQKNPGQFTLPPEEVKFFTRKYRWFLEGVFVNTWVKFMYDRRNSEEWEVKFEFYSRDPDIQGREEMSLITKEKDEPSKDRIESQTHSVKVS
jgi:hypothetical protein